MTPFRFELEPPSSSSDASLDPPKFWKIVEAGSDADFRSANVRTREAQLAPPNLYRQIYVEDFGTGSLRVSTIVDGDPVIVGAYLIRVKL